MTIYEKMFFIILIASFLSCTTSNENIQDNEEKIYNNFDLIIYMEGLNYKPKTGLANESIWGKNNLGNILTNEFFDRIDVFEINYENKIDNNAIEYFDSLVEYYTEKIETIITNYQYENVILIGNNELTIVLPKIYNKLLNKKCISGIILLFRPNELEQLNVEENEIRTFVKYFEDMHNYQSIPGLFIQYTIDKEMARELFLKGVHDPIDIFYYDDYEITNETMFEIITAIKRWVQKYNFIKSD
jgi:glutaredoxin-related protein